MADLPYKYDIFISYAVEDKADIVNELVEKLSECGIKVWYASHKLKAGRGVRETIKEGLNNSRHAVVILSHNYFAKEWPKKELQILWAYEKNPERKIIPVWHNISEKEIFQYDPFLFNKFAICSSKGVDTLIRKIIYSLDPFSQGENTKKPRKKFLKNLRHLTILNFLIIILIAGLHIKDLREKKIHPAIIKSSGMIDPDRSKNILISNDEKYIIILESPSGKVNSAAIKAMN